MKRNSILKGAFLLIICNLIGKVLGAIYKIPLASIVGSKGMGEYQLVFPIYCLILTLSSSGMPVAISKIVSELKAEGKWIKIVAIGKKASEYFTKRGYDVMESYINAAEGMNIYRAADI